MWHMTAVDNELVNVKHIENADCKQNQLMNDGHTRTHGVDDETLTYKTSMKT